MDTETRPQGIPTYVSPVTFWSFTNKLDQGVPQRIDKSMFNGYSGSAIAQILGTYKFLGFTDENGTTLPLLNEVMTAEGDAKAAILRKVVKNSYPFMNGDFDLAKATQGMVDEKFHEAGATGDTIRKCSVFFLHLAKMAGFELSNHLKAPGTSRSSSGKRRPRKSKRKDADDNGRQAENEFEKRSIQHVDTSTSMSRIIAGKMPDFDPTWPTDAQANWVATAKMLMEAERGENK